MTWIKENFGYILIALLALAVIGFAFTPLFTLTKDKCVFVDVGEGAYVKVPSMEAHGPASYKSYAQDCGVPEVSVNDQGNVILDLPSHP